MTNTQEKDAPRQEWISLLGTADPAWLEARKQALKLDLAPAFMVRPETGMIMMQARQDGAGHRFNLGEVTVSRCILKLADVMGYAMVMGSDLRHAELAALFDALLQTEDPGPELQETLLPELRRRREDRRNKEANQARASKVEFFTMKRGE